VDLDLPGPDVDPRLLVILGVPALVIGGLFLWQYSTVLMGEEVEIEVVEPWTRVMYSAGSVLYSDTA